MNEQFAWIGIGGNIGDLESVFRLARASLGDLTDHTIKASPIYQTEPWGLQEQAPFLNQVVGMIPKQGPEQLFNELLSIERAHGRHRPSEVRWGPRTLDLDILSWPNIVKKVGSLILPHPRLHLRRFVLRPWSDIAANHIPFGLEKTVEELLIQCPDDGQIVRTSLSYCVQ